MTSPRLNEAIDFLEGSLREDGYPPSNPHSCESPGWHDDPYLYYFHLEGQSRECI